MSPESSEVLVVMGHTTTKERSEGSLHDKRGAGRTSRQAQLSQESQLPWPADRRFPNGHGSTGGGACSVKSENAGPADQAPCLVVEWTASL